MTTNPNTSPPRQWLGPRIAALVILGIGVVALTQAVAIREGAGYSAVGPRFFPMVAALGLLLLGVAFLLRTTPLSPDNELAEQAAAEERTTHWPTVLLIMAVLVIYVFALGPLGYPLATALFFSAFSSTLPLPASSASVCRRGCWRAFCETENRKQMTDDR